jgi:outer membrane protein insertion porin family
VISTGKITGILLIVLLCISKAWAFDSFVVKDIKVEGLERISLGTVFNYLPLRVGEEIDSTRSAEIIRALYKTGFFEDIRLARKDDTLIISVTERPAVASVKATGNKDISDDQLKDVFKRIGLAQGQVFDPSLLDSVKQELQRQYFSNGKYGVKIDTKVTPLERNRVDVAIDIHEGSVAKIRQIDIVGNTVFSEKELLGQFDLGPPNLFSFYTKNDQYSKQKLAGDLEKLRSYYLDRGYINFNIESTQVTITPDKRDVYITVNIFEGEKYYVSRVGLTGEMVVPKDELQKLIAITPGDVFSRKKISDTTTKIGDRLGRDGYAFANVNTVPEVDKEKKQVALTFYVDPGKRVYVRRINISGNAKTRDEVIRREMRQMEGGWISTDKVKRSRVRLQKLGYFDDVSVETPAVPGTSDQVDVNFNVNERPSGSLTAGFGYSQSQGFLVNASVSQDNFFGTGKRVSATLDNSSVNTIYNLSYTNPYYTLDGVSRGFSAFYRSTDAGQANIADFSSITYGTGVNYGIPLSEYNRGSLGLDYEHTYLKTTSTTPQSYIDFLNENSYKFDILKLSTGWSHDTRNRAIFADRGIYQNLTGQVAVPGGGLTFYKLSYRQLVYVPLSKELTLSLNGRVSYGDGYGSTTQLPFFENYFAGGVDSVRGFKVNSLGPFDSVSGRALGGSFLTVGNAELIFPVPFAGETKSLRLSAFFDIGNVFETVSSFNAGELRGGAGMSVIWISPIAPLTFSLGWPVLRKPGDETQLFQFTLGAFAF